MLTIPQAWAWRTKQKLRPSSQSSVEFLRFAMRKTVGATVKQMQGTKKSTTQSGKTFANVKQNVLHEISTCWKFGQTFWMHCAVWRCVVHDSRCGRNGWGIWDAYSRFTRGTPFHPQGPWCTKKPCSSGFRIFVKHWATFVIAISDYPMTLQFFCAPDLCWNHKKPVWIHTWHGAPLHPTCTSPGGCGVFHLKELKGWMGWIYPRRSLPGPKSWIRSSESPVFPLEKSPFSGEAVVKLWEGSKGCGQNPVSFVGISRVTT